MSKYGIKIKNIEAASIYEYTYGFRNKLDMTDAMLVNSLFLDYLLENNLIRIWNEESTRDVICLLFDYGTKDYKTTLRKLKSFNANEYLDKIKDNVEKNKDKCVKLSKQRLRIKYYTEGVEITYRTYNKHGEEILSKRETIRYKMLYRTPGKAKKGTCMFINENAYEQAHEFLYMGIKLPQNNSPIVEMGAYSSLITSSIIDRVKILPEQILVVKDVDSFFNTSILRVGIDKNRHCTIERQDDYQVVNTLFDGQALIDSSIFPSYAEGYILLRHHLTKMAAFNTNIQLFMRDHFGDSYENATVKDMFGRSVRVKDIRLITTENAIKWIKFDVSFECWANWVRKNDCQFGIVKTVHESKLGDVQRMSYQMMNALDIDSMPSVCTKTVEYINKLKSDNNAFLDYLDKNKNFANDYEVLIALVNHNPDFIRSTYFRERKKAIIRSYVLNFKSGHGIQNADNLTIVGSPYAMLLRSVGLDPFDDPTFTVEKDCIQCWTERFENGEYLAEFRNPFNSRNNLGYMHNVYHEYFGKYFNFGKLIVAVNLIGTDFQDRNNGSDQDSDSIYITNQQDIVAHAKYCYKEYPTIVNMIPKNPNVYNYDMQDFAKIDNNLAAAQLAIGESSNLAQLCLSYTYNYDDQKYQDYVCILSVLAQIAIDNAKRTFNIDLNEEIKRIKEDMDIKKNQYPYFWMITKKDKRKMRSDEARRNRDKMNKQKIKNAINENLKCPMNYLFKLRLDSQRDTASSLGMEEFWIKHELDVHHRHSEKVEKLIQKYSLELYKYNTNDDNESEDYLLLRNDFENLIQDIRSTYISNNYLGLMSWLINRAFCIGAGAKRNKENSSSTLYTNRALLLKVLYNVNPQIFLKCFKKKAAS